MTGFQAALFGIRDAAMAKMPPHIVGWLTFFETTSSLKKRRQGTERPAGCPGAADLIQV
jgi:hypothetical protein